MTSVLSVVLFGFLLAIGFGLGRDLYNGAKYGIRSAYIKGSL